MAIMEGTNHGAAVDYIVSTWTRLKRARQAKQMIWLDCLSSYMRYHDSEKWVKWAKENGYSHRFFAATYDAVEVLTSTLSQSVWRFPDWMGIEPAPHVEDAVDHDDTFAEQIAKALEYYFRLDGGHKKGKQAIKMMVLCGNCPISTSWKREPATDYPAYMRAMQEFQERSTADWQMYQQEVMAWHQQAQIAAQTGDAPPPKPHFRTPHPPVVSPSVAYEGPTVTVDDLFNFVIDEPGAVDRPARIKRVVKPLAWLQKYSQRQEDGYILYENLDQVQDAETPPSSGAETDERAVRAEIFQMEALPTRGVDIKEIQGDLILPMKSQSGDSIFMNWIGAVANDRTLIRWEPGYLWSGRCPTHLAKLIDVPNQAYGMGLIESAVDIQDLINRRMNQIVDSVSVAIYPETKFMDDGVFDPASKTGPGKRHLVGDLNNLQPVSKDARNVQLGMAEVQLLQRWFQQITRAVNPYTETSSESTATEVERNEMLKNVSFNDLVESVEINLVAPIIELFIDHMAMYCGDDVMALITQNGKKTWVTVSPESLRRGWLVKLRGSRKAADQQRRMQNVLMFIELVTGNPVLMQLALQLNMVNVMELLKMAYKEFDLGGEEKIFNDVDPSEIQALMLAMKVQEGGQGEGSGSGDGQGDQVPADQGSYPTG